MDEEDVCDLRGGVSQLLELSKKGNTNCELDQGFRNGGGHAEDDLCC